MNLAEPPTTDHTYIGGELDLFAKARNWKRYWASRLRRYITGSVLEVGAGIGANTELLRTGAEARWVCLEPDPGLAARLQQTITRLNPLGEGLFGLNAADAGTGSASTCLASIEARVGTLSSLEFGELFETILYIDVLEHIQEDRLELAEAAQHLSAGGQLVVLAPAHSWLFSPFDRAIGHFRRYTTGGLKELTPPGLHPTAAFYLDSIGLLASAANRIILRQSLPNSRQIQCWDGFMVPCSRLLDPLIAHKLGKTVVCIWKRPTGQERGLQSAGTPHGSQVTGQQANPRNGLSERRTPVRRYQTPGFDLEGRTVRA